MLMRMRRQVDLKQTCFAVDGQSRTVSLALHQLCAGVRQRSVWPWASEAEEESDVPGEIYIQSILMPSGS